jgi:integrase
MHVAPAVCARRQHAPRARPSTIDAASPLTVPRPQVPAHLLGQLLVSRPGSVLVSAQVWRTNGKPWLSVPPLIEMLDERQQRRQPYPINWSEQAELMKHLPAHLQRMVLFTLNCGARDDNVCALRWAWERKVPELDRSVFVIPAAEFKGKRAHVLVLNDVASKIIEECRGTHDEFVFVWRRERVKNFDEEPAMNYSRVHTMNNTAFQNARRAAKLERVRVHDLRHNSGSRIIPGADRLVFRERRRCSAVAEGAS